MSLPAQLPSAQHVGLGGASGQCSVESQHLISIVPFVINGETVSLPDSQNLACGSGKDR